MSDDTNTTKISIADLTDEEILDMCKQSGVELDEFLVQCETMSDRASEMGISMDLLAGQFGPVLMKAGDALEFNFSSYDYLVSERESEIDDAVLLPILQRGVRYHEIAAVLANWSQQELDDIMKVYRQIMILGTTMGELMDRHGVPAARCINTKED